MTYTYFDVETIPDQSEGALERAKESVKVPANYKNPDTIAAYIEENAQEAWERTALDGWKGHVACIVMNDMKWMVQETWREKEMLQDFFNRLNESTLVGHNIIGFDIPFLTKRALVLGVKLPPEHIWPRNLKPWDNRVFDTMLQLGNGKEFISLDNLARNLGTKGKGNTTGAQVHYMWQNGLHDEIAEYCANDVRIVREIHERFLACNW
ncbi:putative DNA-PolB associated exonuclease [Brucella phage V_19]|uniref:Putative DNA-PolB associated exonuclease n=31 Tax=root TaxID=1 RepID=H2EI89_9CAUD|nr:3'-5' exonuclease [Brucella phage Tb]YP_007002117.1 3'-5' exonuclease [Brucella phage Pr]AHB81110.1 putative DNA-PolB associated exonuclease [Brucella phage Bk]AHB81168.1 putative DNA-PolB associated exonuclease [Brucella phage Fz]AHB81224.1 putative DNA-PolB associated exonuclease [Brucella phage R/C]AHB81280.1 putative DNA-PolB associated exonuclease [Brucella phage S708]AHB81394.1 putative DNA-PolB associated exonuclease [Brucella phage Wb]AKO59040.1 putative DNA-PolB associated exonuc